MVAHRRLVRARPYAGPAQQSAHRGRIRGRRSAVRSSSCGGQVLSRQPLGQRPSLYVVCHVTWSAMLRGLSCYVVCDVAWAVMSRGLSCCVVCDVAWSVMSRGLSCCVVCDVAWSVMPGQARMVFTRGQFPKQIR